MVVYPKTLTDTDDTYIKVQYQDVGRSVSEIAKDLDTYPNKVLRSLKRTKTHVRTNSEAQKLALSSGRRIHPTKGKKLSEEMKIRISDGVSNAWENKNPILKKMIKEQSTERWNNMTEEARDVFFKASSKAIRETSTKGSKLEKTLYQDLTNKGFAVEYHKDRMIENQKLQIDMLLPEYLVAIEIDGPSHFLPIWGEDALLRSMKADMEKNGLLLRNGFVVLRITNTRKTVSAKLCRTVCELVTKTLEKIQSKFPDKQHRLIEIEV